MAIRTVKEQLQTLVQEAMNSLYQEGFLQGEPTSIFIEPPKQASHGDFACTAALGLAKAARKNPREIAARLQDAIPENTLVARTEIAGPGFLNFFINASAWQDALVDVLNHGETYLHSDFGKGKRVLVEYVSANPTGPLHFAHGRGAVLGDVVSRMLSCIGFDVVREYYVNDQGNQTTVLAQSIYIRYQELFGQEPQHPEDFYPGDYIKEIARVLGEELGDKYLNKPEEQWLEPFKTRGIELMRTRIKDDLNALGVEFDSWISEKELTDELDLDKVIGRIAEKGHIFVDEGKTWFKTSDFGDDKDRVVKREDGRTTYFASDIAYHDNKIDRGFSHLINLWGADHGGYIARVKAGLSALGHDPAALEILLLQMVSLSRGGVKVRMGKRLGTAVWLRDVISEAGKDATRYFFLMRRSDAQMDFDIDLAAKKSLDNPVYYAQMGHARMCSIAKKAQEAGYTTPPVSAEALRALVLPEELGLIKTMLRSPTVLRDAALNREPHQVVHFIQALIAQFHSYYSQYSKTERVISDDREKTIARLLLCRALQSTLKCFLDLLGVDAPEQMYLEDATRN